MQELKLVDSLKKNIDAFVEDLKQLYAEDLVSVILYGSAASGEHSQKHSNINILIVLKSVDLSSLDKSRKLIHKFSNRRVDPLFLSEAYILSSTDVFPIEFLDMKENYHCLYGKDVFKELKIDLKNLRFQCEQELKSKLIFLRQQYLTINSKDSQALTNLLFKSFTSIVHILRNALRLKGKEPSYSKEAALKELIVEFSLGSDVFLKIWQAKRDSIKLKEDNLQALLKEFVLELDKVAEKVDQL